MVMRFFPGVHLSHSHELHCCLGSRGNSQSCGHKACHSEGLCSCDLQFTHWSDLRVNAKSWLPKHPAGVQVVSGRGLELAWLRCCLAAARTQSGRRLAVDLRGRAASAGRLTVRGWLVIVEQAIPTALWILSLKIWLWYWRLCSG